MNGAVLAHAHYQLAAAPVDHQPVCPVTCWACQRHLAASPASMHASIGDHLERGLRGHLIGRETVLGNGQRKAVPGEHAAFFEPVADGVAVMQWHAAAFGQMNHG